MTAKDIIDVLRDGGIELHSTLVSDTKISGISDDSRKIGEGFVFVAVKGLKFDGNEYISDAVSKKASLILSEVNLPEKYSGMVNFVKVKNSRAALALLSSCWYGNPASKLKIIGVTGTKGKTTVVHLIYHIMKNLGLKVGMVSTVKAVIAERVYDTGLHVTNPDALLLHKFFKEMVEKGIEYAVIEVTSHGLDQERVYGVDFDIGVLTNITKEHLDYHKTFSRYRKAKFKLFEHSNRWVLNKDDKTYKLFAGSVGDRQLTTYSQRNSADFFGSVMEAENGLMHYSVKENGVLYKGTISLMGEYNLYNILAAVSAVNFVGIKTSQSLKTLMSFIPPEGRLEKVENKRDINIYIDFAHTPDSLENLLKLLSSKRKGRLISVFGCAGERDGKKRYEMGRISGEISDITVITAEDPRSENVLDICRQIRKGVQKSGAVDYFGVFGKPGVINKVLKNKKHLYLTIPDRHEAIYYSINKIAQKDDTVVFCGKGHEKSMCYENVEHPWSDVLEIKKALSTNFDKTAIVLGAGRGKRLNSDLPKVIHKLAGKPMVSYTVNNLRLAGYSNICLVVGYKSKSVIEEVGPSLDFAFQKKPLGTAHAALVGIRNVTGNKPILVVNGDDSAFYKQETFNDIFQSHLKSGAVLTITTAIIEEPQGLGRVIRDKKGVIARIVEEKEADNVEKRVKECNIGMYCFDKEWFLKNIELVKRRGSGEYYITDLIGIAVLQKEKVNIFQLKDSNQWCGVNTPEQLITADKKMRDLIAKKMESNNS